MQAESQQDLSSIPPRLSYRTKVMYGIGDISNAIKVVTFGIYALFFASSVKGVPGTWIGVVGFIAILWDAIIDPCIGYLTDGPRAGAKRFNFMLVGALTMGIGFWAFFSPPRNLSTVMLCIWLLAASFVVRTATSIYSIPYYAVGMNLSRDYHERTSITGIRSLASGVGTLLTASLSFIVFFPEKVAGVDPKLNPKGYAAMGLIFGTVMTAVALIALLGTARIQRRIQDDAFQVEQAAGDFMRSMWDSLRNPSFRAMVFSFSLGVVAMALNGSLGLHFLKYYAEASASVTISTFQAVFFISGLLGTIFWLRICSKFDKHYLYVISTSVTAVISLAAPALFGKGHPLGTGNARALMIGYGLAGFFSCVVWFIPQSMLADVADHGELMAGQRREGALFGMFSFAQQVATGVAVLMAGALLDRFVGLVPGALQQSSTVASRIGIVYGAVPAALLIVSALLMLSYPLTRSRVESLQVELRQRRLAQQTANAG